MALRQQLHPLSLEQQLFLALDRQNVGALSGLLLAGADANATNELGQTAVEAAFHAGCPDEMRILLVEAGADVRPVIAWIGWAALAAPPRVLQSFLDAGADADLPSTNGTPLQIASRNGRLAAVRILLLSGADPSAGDPLADAIERGFGQCALALIAAGARPEPSNRFRSVLGMAAYHGMTKVVEALVEAGAELEGQVTLLADPHLRDALTRAFDQLFDTGHDEAMSGRTAVRYANATPLMVAAGEGHEGVVRLLTSCGADTETVDDTFQTPFAVARRRGHTPVMVALLDGGACCNPVMPPEHRLLCAAESGDALEVSVLVARDIDLEMADPRLLTQGETPLMLAAGRGHEPVVDVLIDAGVALDTGLAVNPTRGRVDGLPVLVAGRTALMQAAIGGHGRVVTRLVRAGADRDGTDADGKTAQQLAREAGHETVIEALAAAGVEPVPEIRAAVPAPAATKPPSRATKKTAKKAKVVAKAARKKAKKVVAKTTKKTAKKTAKKAAKKAPARKKAKKKAAAKTTKKAAKKTAKKAPARKKASKKKVARKTSKKRAAPKVRTTRSRSR